MGRQRTPEQLAKFLDYVLGRRPDEFGLVPDRDGFVKKKELLKAINEEEGWRYVRQAHINEVILTMGEQVVEVCENRVRAANRQQLVQRQVAHNLPKHLYTCVRKKAYPVVLEKGILPMGRGMVVLSANREMALRMGRRMDAQAVILTVSVRKMHEGGAILLSAGGDLFLTQEIFPGCFTGPPLPKEKADNKKKELVPPVSVPKQPGSFYLTPERATRENRQGPKTGRRKKEADWKKDRKKLIKIKRKTGLPF